MSEENQGLRVLGTRVVETVLMSALVGAASVWGMTLVMEEKVKNMELAMARMEQTQIRYSDRLDEHMMVGAHQVAETRLDAMDQRLSALEAQNAQMFVRILAELERLKTRHESDG